MNIDQLTEEFEAVVDRARDVLTQEITRVRKVVDALNAEKVTVQATISQLQEQRAQAQSQLDAVLADLHKGSTLAGLDSEITKARAELERLNGETERVSKDLERLTLERIEAERRVIALSNEAQRLVAVRSESEAAMIRIRAQLQ